MDPVIHMMFKAVASRLKEVNDRINGISDAIIRDLACRIFFDGLLHPVPASTILKFTTGVGQAIVDDTIESYWVNTTLKESATFYFSPATPKTLYPFEAVVALAKNSDGAYVLWTDPQWKGGSRFLVGFNPSRGPADIDERDCIYIGLKPGGAEKECHATDLFVDCSSELHGLMRWARWRFTEGKGEFGQPYFPGRQALKRLEKLRSSPEISVWGHCYFPEEHREEYADSFFDIAPGTVGVAPQEIRESFPGQSDGFWDGVEPLYWIQIDSDKRIPTSVLKSIELVASNCVVAINTHFQKQSFFYHGPGAMAFELQTPAGGLYEIISIDDNRGRVYSNVYAVGKGGDPDCRYIPRVDGDRLRLIVSPPSGGPAPDRFLVSFRTSAGAAANGIGPGLINSLYTPQPGIESAMSLTETRGGVFAKTFDDMMASFPHVLRSHNRAIVTADFEALALAFDSRIRSARARMGSTVRGGSMYRCVEVEVDLGGLKFAPEEEAKLFAARLQHYLEARSPMGTAVVARIL